jgi:hypothetical protein
LRPECWKFLASRWQPSGWDRMPIGMPRQSSWPRSYYRTASISQFASIVLPQNVI